MNTKTKDLPRVYFSCPPLTIPYGNGPGSRRNFKDLIDALRGHVSVISWALDDFWMIKRTEVRSFEQRQDIVEKQADLVVCILTTRTGSFSQGIEFLLRAETCLPTMVFAHKRVGVLSRFMRTLFFRKGKRVVRFTNYLEIKDPILEHFASKRTDL